MKTDAGIVVEASESAAHRLSTYFGWKRIPEDPMPVEDISEPVAVAPKRKPGRPKKVVND
jgi:hypothetical protein